MRNALAGLFDEVLRRLDLPRCFAAHADRLRAFADRPLLVVAFGKAARTMADAATALLPDDLPRRGLVVPPAPDDRPLAPFEVIAGGHPLPDRGSMRAGSRALELLDTVTGAERVLFLISGGGSALLEQPQSAAVTLEQLRRLNAALVGSGASIEQINTVRRHVSATKGGRLAIAGRAADRQLTLAISDVPGDAPSALASGPTVPDASTTAACRAVLDRYSLWPSVPSPLAELLRRDETTPPLAPDDELVARSEFAIVLGERNARRAAVDALLERDPACVVDDAVDVDDWPYERAAEHLLQRLDTLHEENPGRRVAVVTTGELSVPLPSDPGVGGRNQQFALHCAARVAGRQIAVLSCGTDGIDGTAPAAGALVDGTTVARAAAAGFDAARHLRRCDAHPLLEAIGDAVVTGPTGQNVRDLRVLVRDA